MKKLTSKQKKTLLGKFKEPRFPYVLFGYVSRSGMGASTPKDKTFCLDVSGHHKSLNSIENYLQKGYEILSYSVPEQNEQNLKIFNGEDPFAQLRGYLQRLSADPGKIDELKDENIELKKKLKEIEKQENKSNGSKGLRETNETATSD